MKKSPNTSMIYSRRQGFTLMEVLVSSALTVVILTMLFTVLIGAMNAWQTGTNRLQGNADARMALDSIATDLQSMVVRQTSLGMFGQEWIISEPSTLENLPDSINLRSTRLFFFAPSLDREPGQQGDIVAIHYQVAFADPLRGNIDGTAASTDYNIFGLYKRMASTEETFRKVLGNEDIWTGYWIGNASPRSEDLFIPNVVKFDVSWNILVQGDPDDEDDLAGQRVENELLRLRNNLISVTHQMSMPKRIESADISLTILTDEGMRMAQTFARGPGLNNDNLQRIIREHGRVYTKRVKIQY